MSFRRPLRVMILLGCMATSAIVATAACIGPMIRLYRNDGPSNEGPPGTVVIVTGSAFIDGCHDVCFNGVCPPTYPATGVKILFIQGDKAEVVARVDADKTYNISVDAAVPDSAVAGRASFVAETLYGGRYLRTPPVAFIVTSKR